MSELVFGSENWSEGFTYAWSTGSTDSTITVKPSETTQYTVQIENPILDIYTSRTFVVKVKNEPIETEDAELFVNKFTCPGEDLEVQVAASGGHGT